MKFFPGCMIHNRYPGVEASLYFVFEKLGIDISPLEGSSCCPAPGVVKSVSEELWLELARRNLSLSNESLLTACNGCFTTLLEASSRMDGVEVRHVAEFLYRDVGVEEIKKRVVKRLPIRVAVHYGCHFFRPGKSKGLDSEKPVMLDELVEAIGAESVNYRHKFVCCGGGGGVRAAVTEVANDILSLKMDAISAAEVDAIVVICPLCLHQFDVGQVELREQRGEEYEIPAIHYIQLLAIAMGMDVEKSGLVHHSIVTAELVEKLIQGEIMD